VWSYSHFTDTRSHAATSSGVRISDVEDGDITVLLAALFYDLVHPHGLVRLVLVITLC
jgi:hypothetical protein